MYINLIISVVIILIIFILINKKNKEKFSVQSDTEFAEDYCKTYCKHRDHTYDDGFGTIDDCSDKCKESINLNINTLKKGSTQALSNLFNINLIKQIGAKDEIISSQANEISKFEEESILKSNVDGIKALGYISEDDCTIHPTTELCAITKTDIGNKKTIKTQSENGEQSWGLIGTNSGEYGKIGDGKGDNEYGKIGTEPGEYGKIGTNLGEYMSVNQCRTAKSANDADIRSQCTVANASDKNSYITKYDANVKKQNAISEAEKKIREELADGCLVEIAKNRNDFMRVDDCVLTPKKYAEATRTLGTDNKFIITTPDVAGKKWVEISDEYKDKIQVKRFVNSELENHLIENYNPSDKTQYNVDYKIEVEDAKLSDIKNLGDLLYSDYVEIEIELDGDRGTIKKYFKPVKNDDGGGIDKQWGLIGENDNEYLLRSVAKTLNWCDIGKVCKPINYIDPTSCTFDMISDEEKLNYIQSDGCSIKKTNLKNHIDATTPPAILKLPYNDGAPESDDINSLWGKIYPDDAPTEEAKNGYYGKIGTESNNYMIRSECSVTNDQFKNWMEKSQCALTHSQKEKNLTVNENGPLNVIKTVGSTETETWGKIGTITGKYGKIGSDNGDYGVIGTSPEQYMLNSDCGINTNIITRDSKLISAKNGSKWGKVSDDHQGANEGNDGYYGVIGDYNSQDSQSDDKYMKISKCAISTDSIDGNGPITTRDKLSKWGKISAESGTEGTSTYYGKIGTGDNDYIKNSICNSQKDDHLNTYCKLTRLNFDTQTSTSPNKIEIDTESSWGRIGSGNGYYGKIGEGGGEYMINDDCHTLQTDVKTNNTAIAKDQTYWGKIGENAEGNRGGVGYYGLIGDELGFYGKIGENNGDYGKIGTEDNDYIKKSDCDSSKDGYLSDNCKLTISNFNLQQKETTKKINIDNHYWGKIYPDDAQTEEAKNGYYGKIGTGDDQYMLNSRCAIGTDSIDGYGPITTRDGSSSWGKVSDEQGSGTNEYYGKIGTEDNDYIIRSEANTNTLESINAKCELLKLDVNGGTDNLGKSSITQRTWGKVSDAGGSNSGKNDYYGKIGSNSGDYGKIGDLEGEYGEIGAYDQGVITTNDKYMKNSDCAIEVKDLNGKNLVSAKDASQWGKVSEAGQSGISGNYGQIGDENDKYMLYQNCELLKLDVNGGTDNLGTSTITQRTWGKVSDTGGSNSGKNDYYGKIGSNSGDYGKIGSTSGDYGEIGAYDPDDITTNDKYMKNSKCAIEVKDLNGKNLVSAKDASQWGKVSEADGSGIGSPENYGQIGDENDKYMLYQNCELLQSDVDSVTNSGISTITQRTWGKVKESNGNGFGFDGYYGKIGKGFGNNEYGLISDDENDYMIRKNCLYEQQDQISKVPNIIKLKNQENEWGKIGGASDEYITNNEADADRYASLSTDCEFTKGDVGGNKSMTGKDRRTWGLIGVGSGDYGEIGTYHSDGRNSDKYMLNSECAISTTDINGGNGPITTRDGSSWGRIGTGNGYYGEIGTGDGYYGKIGAYDPGDSGTDNKYMLNSECAISTTDINGYGPITTRDGSSSWGKVSNAQGEEGSDGYYGKIGAYDPGDSGTDNKYMLNSECAISTDSINGNGPITTRNGLSSWGKVSDADRLNSGKDNYYGKIGKNDGEYIQYDEIVELITNIDSEEQKFDNIEIENIILNESLNDFETSNKTIKSGWVSGNIIDGDDNSKITVFAYKCIKKNSKIYKDDDESSSILRIFKGSITHCVVDSKNGSKRYIYFKDNKNALEQGYINLSKQLGDDWTNENIGNNILCENSELGCIEIEKKP
jgi:hypothetical protein